MTWTCQGCGRNYEAVKGMVTEKPTLHGRQVVLSEVLSETHDEYRVGWECLACEKFHKCSFLERELDNP